MFGGRAGGPASARATNITATKANETALRVAPPAIKKTCARRPFLTFRQFFIIAVIGVGPFAEDGCFEDAVRLRKGRIRRRIAPLNFCQHVDPVDHAAERRVSPVELDRRQKREGRIATRPCRARRGPC